MKKFLALLTVLVALAVTMPPATTAYASIEKISSIQTVDCSWWGKQVNRKYTESERRRWQQQQQWLEQQRRQREQQRRQQRRY